jgi:hypothetical protein
MDIFKLEEMCFTIKIEILRFVNKNWLDNPIIVCKPLFNLVELIEKDLDSEEELEEFENSFDGDEHLHM